METLFPLSTRMSLMHEQTPIMYVFAGNNGSGKSTIRNLIVDRLGISVNIDPDALAPTEDIIRRHDTSITLMPWSTTHRQNVG